METKIIEKAPVTLTPNAIHEVKELLKNGNYDARYGLRLGVRGGGCAGFSYILDFDTQKDTDHVFAIEGISIFIDKSQEIYLYDCEIDFKNGLDNRGFIFNNPNATSTCGCGTSFSA
ncbi:MAG TPA: iron-sulfur cluster assembly accessory protein [Chitinophagales bacterium]|nr:iron-sulfur cluster assembly accessory protein [Chitinophagales bacterium]HNM31847.1 iron-sulfur cluster assembly accessory protein [Chitinophagales bacterium]